MWSEVLAYVTVLLYFNCKPAFVHSKSVTRIATVEPQYLSIDLSTHSNSWYIIGQQDTDTINITVTYVKIGNGHAGFGIVDECKVDFVSIFDANKSSENGLKICGKTVKDEWKGWESTSNNVSIIYSTKTFGRFGYSVTLEYLRNRHVCQNNGTICQHGQCIDKNNQDGYYCTCKLGYTGKNCDKREEPVFEILQATNESKLFIVDNSSNTNSRKWVWIITAEQNHIINVSLSIGNKKDPSSPHNASLPLNTSSFITIRDTNDENHSKKFSQSDLQNGVLWLSQSNNVSIECDEMCRDIKISYAAPPEIQLIRVSSEIENLTLNHRSNRKHHFVAEEGYYIKLFLSVSGSPTTFNIDTNHSECIKIYDQSKNASLSINDLLNRGYQWSSNSNEITIEWKDKYRDKGLTIEFQKIWKKCSSSPCENDGTCSANPPNSYFCTCKRGFDGERCEKISGEHCAADTYTVPFNKYIFHWKDTFLGSIATLPCPINYTGYATRVCVKSNNSENGGIWNKPNLTECVSKEIQMIDNEANILVYTNGISSVVFNNLTTRLTAATSKFSEIDMYPGDLTTATHAVHTLSNMVNSITTAESSELSMVAQGYGEAVGNIIDPSLIDVWTYTSEDAVQSNMLSILTSVERLSANVAKKKVHSLHRKKREITQFTANETVHVKANNLEFHISLHEKIAMCEDSFSITLGDDTSSGVTLTSAVFKAAIENTADRYIQVYNARFSSVAEVIDASRSANEPDLSKRGKVTPYINSDILSSRILNIKESKFENLAQPVIIMLEIKNKTVSPELKEKCVFVNMSSSDHNIWADRGCKVDYLLSNSTHIACKCTHLTNFAVLMDVFDVQKEIDYTDYTILTYITYVGGVMSALACIITVIVFQFFSLRKERVLVHQQLALSIVLVQVFFLVGIDRTENKYVCIVMAALLHYSVIAMFCWMLIEGFHLYIMLVKVFRRKANFRKYVIFGWGFPLVVVGISLGVFHDQYGGSVRCWLSHSILLMAFVPVVCLVIVINTVILIIVLRIMMKSMLSRANSEERSAIKAGLKAAAILLPLLGTTWTLGFFSVNNKDTLIFTYLFTFFNSLQGVFFFVFHCLLNTDVKNAFERRSQRRSLTKLLEESLNQDSRTRKSSTLNTALTSKSSMNSILTDESVPWRRKQKMSNNDMDRIHRANIAELSEKQYHHNLQRSFSDGIPRWQNVNKEFHFYTGKENINILKAQPFYSGDKFNENGHLIRKQHSHDTNDDSKDFRIEDLYSKPTRKGISADDKDGPIQKDNRVRFDEIDSKAGAVNEIKEAFVQELKERTTSIRT